jgi:hypothetical protein
MDRLLTTTVFLFFAFQAQAAPIQLLLESDADAAGGDEIFLATFDTYTDLVDFNLSNSTFSQVNIRSDFSVGGFAYDGSSYQLLLESDADAVGGDEIFLATFNSFADLIDFNLSNSTFSQVNIRSDFSVGGFSYDGSSYQLLLESDADAAGGDEIFLANFDTFADLIDFNLSSSTFSQVNIRSDFSVGGFSYDGTAYQLLLESITDAAGGDEIFLATFDTYADLVDFNLSNSTFSQVNIRSDFSVGGYTYEVARVPEPGTVALLVIGLFGLGFSKRKV